MVVGLLGILNVGGAYLPLDPAYPQPRIDFMLRDAKAPVTVTTSDLTNSLPPLEGRTVCLEIESKAISREHELNLHEDVTLENLAYVIYTSGSTGRPKGVQIEHGAILNLLTSMRLEPGIRPEDVLLAVTTPILTTALPVHFAPSYNLSSS
jgi:non-ribosomal peptide synthetase component F